MDTLIESKCSFQYFRFSRTKHHAVLEEIHTNCSNPDDYEFNFYCDKYAFLHMIRPKEYGVAENLQTVLNEV